MALQCGHTERYKVNLTLNNTNLFEIREHEHSHKNRR